MSSWVNRIDRSFYFEYDSNWDDLALREQILAYLTSSSIIMDLGAGAGILQQTNFRGLAEQVCGIDLDPRVLHNPMLDDGKIANATCIPYGRENFDLVFADNVLEHLSDPQTVFREVARILKPGGVFIFKTPNRRHYMPTISRLTPHRFHQFYNRLRGRADDDTFPTYYKANTRREIKRLAEDAELLIERVRCIEGRPEYLRMFAPAYMAGTLYERIVNSTTVLEDFRVVLIGVLRKPI